MSVFVWTEIELGALIGALGAEQQTIQAALILGTANRAAFALTYYVGRAGEHEDWHNETWGTVAPLQLRDEHIDQHAACPHVDARTWVRQLLENCVSNGGADFAPAGAATVLLNAARRKDADALTPASADALCEHAQQQLRTINEQQAGGVFVSETRLRAAERDVEEAAALARFVSGSRAHRDECQRMARLCNMDQYAGD